MRIAVFHKLAGKCCECKDSICQFPDAAGYKQRFKRIDELVAVLCDEEHFVDEQIGILFEDHQLDFIGKS